MKKIKNEQYRKIYLYINKSIFPPYVKIGYANNVEARVKKLNQTECTPFWIQNLRKIQSQFKAE